MSPSTACSTPKPGRPSMPCSPSSPHRACAIPTMKPRVWTANPARRAVRGDFRSQGQRNHDALKAMGRSVLASGELGKHNGLPAPSLCPPPCRTCSPRPVWLSPAGHLVADARCDPIGVAVKSLPGDLRQTHPAAAVLWARQALRHTRAAHRVALLDAAALGRAAPHRATGLRSTTLTAGPPPTAKPTSTSSPWPADPTTASSKKAAGPRGNAKTAAPNGSRRHTSTPDKPESTTTTIPRSTSCPKMMTPSRRSCPVC